MGRTGEELIPSKQKKSPTSRRPQVLPARSSSLAGPPNGRLAQTRAGLGGSTQLGAFSLCYTFVDYKNI